MEDNSMIIQQPRQLKENLQWKMVETSDEDSSHFIELCDCTIGHNSEFEAKLCAKQTEILKNPVKLEEAFAETKCYKCKHFTAFQRPTKLTKNTKEISGVWKGTQLERWCKRPEMQTEADDYNGVYHDADSAEEKCFDYEWKWFEETQDVAILA